MKSIEMYKKLNRVYFSSFVLNLVAVVIVMLTTSQITSTKNVYNYNNETSDAMILAYVFGCMGIILFIIALFFDFKFNKKILEEINKQMSELGLK